MIRDSKLLVVFKEHYPPGNSNMRRTVKLVLFPPPPTDHVDFAASLSRAVLKKTLCRSGHMDKIKHAGTQVVQWDFQNKGRSRWTGTSCFALDMCDFVPRDWIVQRA